MSVDMIEIITELPCLKLLNMSDTVREGPKIKINSFIEKLPGDSELPTLEIILGGKFYSCLLCYNVRKHIIVGHRIV